MQDYHHEAIMAKAIRLSRRRRHLLRYIRQHGWVRATCRLTKLATGYPQRARKSRKTYSQALKALWLRGELEGVRINGVWYYTPTTAAPPDNGGNHTEQ